jgi:hypothetical protein
MFWCMGEGLTNSDDSEFSFLPPFQSKLKQLHVMWPCKVTLNWKGIFHVHKPAKDTPMLRLIPATLAPNFLNFIDILKTPNEVKTL